MTFEPSASQAQIGARQHAFDNQPNLQLILIAIYLKKHSQKPN